MARQNDFLEGIRKGMQAYMQTRQFIQQQKSAEMNQKYMEEMTNRMRQPQEKPWGSTPETYEEKLKIENRNKPTEQEKPQAWKPTTMDEKLEYDEQRAKRLSKYKDGGKGKEAKPSLFAKYGITEGDTAALDKAIRDGSKGTQVLGRDKGGDWSVVKAPGAPKSPLINPAALGDEKITDAVNSFLDEEAPNLKDTKSLQYPTDLTRKIKLTFARRDFTLKMLGDLKATVAAYQIVDIDNAALLQGDKGLANHIRNRIDAWKTKNEPLFNNFPVPKTIDEASAQVRQWVPMMKNSTR